MTALGGAGLVEVIDWRVALGGSAPVERDQSGEPQERKANESHALSRAKGA